MAIDKQFLEHRSSTIFIVLAVLLCAVFLFETLKLWTGYGGEEQVRSSGNQLALTFDAQRITSKNLFDQTAATETANVVATYRPSNELVLEAIFESSDSAHSQVIISSSSSPAKTYGVNSQLADGMRIERIERDHVVVVHDGREQVLKFSVADSTVQVAALEAPALSESSGLGQPTEPASLSDKEFSHLVSALPIEEQQKVQREVVSGDLAGLMKTVSANTKVALVKERLEQLRKDSRNN